jgi:transcriptional regulator with XRE-family HTH domain
MNTFSKRLNILMKRNDLTARAAARVAGVTPSTYHEWLSGSHPRNFEAVLKLAEYFNVSMAYLLVGKIEKKHGEEVLSDMVSATTQIFEGFLEVKITKLIPKASGDDK